MDKTIGTEVRQTAVTHKLIGREAECNLLRENFKLACDGHSQFIFINGEPGWGKSTLIEYFLKQYAKNAVVAKGCCLIAREESEPYFPFLDLFSSLSESYVNEPVGITKKKAATYGKVFAKAILENSAGLIGTFIPAYSNVIKIIKKVEGCVGEINSQLEKAQQVTTGIDTSQLQLQFAKVLESISKEYPLVLVIDSLQWADINSIDLLFYLSTRLKKKPILFIYSLNDSELLCLESAPCRLLKKTINELRPKDNHHWLDM
ncbi:MAG: ATP-binding protein, partial [Candidatus Electrothrix sp. AUS4]|nr:ATP-binding protein [Candidatus Electrothrix sp. AUS4]